MPDIQLQDPAGTCGVASFSLVQNVLRVLVNNGTLPKDQVFAGIRAAVAELESAGDEGLLLVLNEAAAGLIRTSYPSAFATPTSE